MKTILINENSLIGRHDLFVNGEWITKCDITHVGVSPSGNIQFLKTKNNYIYNFAHIQRMIPR